jgi:hypothetical protein
MDWFRELVRTDTGIFWLAVSAMVVLPSLVWGITEVIGMVLRHNERLEMIRHGMHPDTPYPGKKKAEDERASGEAVTL